MYNQYLNAQPENPFFDGVYRSVDDMAGPPAMERMEPVEEATFAPPPPPPLPGPPGPPPPPPPRHGAESALRLPEIDSETLIVVALALFLFCRSSDELGEALIVMAVLIGLGL